MSNFEDGGGEFDTMRNRMSVDGFNGEQRQPTPSVENWQQLEKQSDADGWWMEIGCPQKFDI